MLFSLALAVHALEVVFADAETNTDHGDIDAVIRANDPAGEGAVFCP